MSSGPPTGASSLPWSRTRDDAPAIEAGKPYLAGVINKVGRFRRVDPEEPGSLWSRWRWLGLVFWVGVLAGAIAKAWRDEGGLPDPSDPPAS